MDFRFMVKLDKASAIDQSNNSKRIVIYNQFQNELTMSKQSEIFNDLELKNVYCPDTTGFKFMLYRSLIYLIYPNMRTQSYENMPEIRQIHIDCDDRADDVAIVKSIFSSIGSVSLFKGNTLLNMHTKSIESTPDFFEVVIQYIKATKTTGSMIVKFTDISSKNHMWLLDQLTNYFEDVCMLQSYYSNIFDNDAYLLCRNRNLTECMLSPESYGVSNLYIPSNYDKITMFDYARFAYRDMLHGIIMQSYQYLLQINAKISWQSISDNLCVNSHKYRIHLMSIDSAA